jgi:hypothetical protein
MTTTGEGTHWTEFERVVSTQKNTPERDARIWIEMQSWSKLA